MPPTLSASYDLIWDYENQFAYKVARQVIQKPKVSVWLVLMPILFLFYAHKIQQYKAGIHKFSQGLMRTKILALDSALEEINTGRVDEEVRKNLAASDSEASVAVMRVRNQQLAEVELLKAHYNKLLRQPGTSYQTLIQKTYQTGGAYRLFVNQLTRIENEVLEAVLEAYYPKEEERRITEKMQAAIYALREQDVRTFFG